MAVVEGQDGAGGVTSARGATTLECLARTAAPKIRKKRVLGCPEDMHGWSAMFRGVRRSCAYVTHNPSMRCNATDAHGVPGFDACPAACGRCPQDPEHAALPEFHICCCGGAPSSVLV